MKVAMTMNSAVFSGIPELVDFTIRLAQERIRRDSLTLVTYHQLGEILHSAEHALYHYFPLTLEEHFLQNSHIGSPYQKWAKFTNEDFEELTDAVVTLLPLTSRLYSEVSDATEGKACTTKTACICFSEVKLRYRCCVIDPDEPLLRLDELCLNRFIAAENGFFTRPEGIPTDWPVVVSSTHSISDRKVIADLQRTGIEQLSAIRSAIARFATWLRENYTIGEVTTPYREPYSSIR